MPDPVVPLTGGQASASGPLLGDLYQVIVPRVIKLAEVGATQRTADSIRYLRSRDLDSAIIVDPEQVDDSDFDEGQWLTAAPPQNLIQAGDVLMVTFFGLRGPRLSLVEQIRMPTAVSQTILVLRPIVPIEPGHHRLTMAFLRSSPQLRRLCTSFKGDFRISPRALLGLRVPSRDDALSAVLDELDSAGNQMARWHQEAENLADDVFGESEEPWRHAAQSSAPAS